MRRRDFLRGGAAAAAGAFVSKSKVVGEPGLGLVMTVTGQIAADAMGFTLTHEHVLVDLVGADQITPDRYDGDQAFKKILPYLRRARDLGCETLVECTPSYIGRDPALLKRLSEATSLHILTNTGYYGAADDKFVPRHAYHESAQQLADRWVKEWEEGIGGTEVRPGFIKVGVDGTPLTDIDRKLVVAAACTHTRTGLVILSHTGDSAPAMEQIAILKAEGVHPSAWVWTHAQNERNNDNHERAAREGAWIAFDGLHKDRLDRDLKHLSEMKRRGCLENVLLSHDAGWYQPGKPEGGHYRPHEDLFTCVIPAMLKKGFAEAEIHLLTVVNPHRAFAVEVRTV